MNPTMPDISRRRARLLRLLPQIYAAQPGGSAVSALLDVMARTLSDFDQDLKRVLHDRWVALASGTADELTDAGDAAALDRLGELLQIERLPAAIRHLGYEQTKPPGERVTVRFASEQERDEAVSLLAVPFPVSKSYDKEVPRIAGLLIRLSGNDSLGLTFTPHTGLAASTPSPLLALLPLLQPEPTESYRQRLQISVAVIGQGLTTPRAILSLAIADLGAEPCPKLRRERDATLARAVPLGTRKRCRACTDAALECPNPTLFDAWITEQPTQDTQWHEPNARLHQHLTVNSDSLIGDRPVLTLSVDHPVSYPAIQSLTSGEIVLFADDLLPGSTLRLLPQLSAEEIGAAVSYDRPVSHSWVARSPKGRAELIGPTGAVTDVSESIYYLWGSRFDAETSRLGGANVDGFRCGDLGQVVRTPLLPPGENELVLLNFTAPAYRFDAETSILASDGSQTGAHFALIDQSISNADAKFADQLFSILATSNTDNGDSNAADSYKFNLKLDWIIRPPCSFHLRMPKNGWIQAAGLRGAVDLMLIDIQRARAAGVRARVDFPEPVYREHLEPIEKAPPALSVGLRWDEDARSIASFSMTAQTTQIETHDISEGSLTIGAIWGTTRFDSSTLQ